MKPGGVSLRVFSDETREPPFETTYRDRLFLSIEQFTFT